MPARDRRRSPTGRSLKRPAELLGRNVAVSVILTEHDVDAWSCRSANYTAPVERHEPSETARVEVGSGERRHRRGSADPEHLHGGTRVLACGRRPLPRFQVVDAVVGRRLRAALSWLYR